MTRRSIFATVAATWASALSIPRLCGFFQAPAVVGDEHILLCHVDFLRFYRVRLIEKNQQGVECKSWAGWRLINDAPADEKEQHKADMKFYRANNIEIQFAAVEGKLPA